MAGGRVVTAAAAVRGAVLRTAAVLTGVLVMLAATVLPASADPDTPPFDPGADWTLLGSEEAPASAGAAACDAGERWTWSAGDQETALLVVPCRTEGAAGGFWEWLGIRGEVVAGVVQHYERTLWDGDTVTRAWVADGGGSQFELAVLQTHCPGTGRDACVEATAAMAAAAMAALPGGTAGVETPGFSIQLIQLSLVVPVVMIGVVLGLARGVTALLRPRYVSASTSDRFHDVSRRVSRARWRRRIRRTLLWTVAYLVSIGIAALTIRDYSQIFGAVILVTPCAILIAIGYRTFLRTDPVERGRRTLTGLGAGAAVGSFLSVMALAMLALVLLVHVLLSGYGPMQAGWPSTSLEDIRRMGLPLLAGLLPLARSLGDGATYTSMVLAVPALVLVAAVDGLGQRLRSASVDEALAQDQRPHYLYLRSFDEDRLKLAGTLRRRGVISALSVMRRVRFEEVLVRQLSATGPVIAIAPPGTNLPAIGAARASFSNDEWQEHVMRYAQTARAVVLSATPGEVRQGFGWELDLIANRIGHQRVIVVLGPWQPGSLRRRWTQFCLAVSHVPFFAPITMPWVPDGVHVLAHSPRLGWHAWGARRRLDWTYAVAIDEATRAYMQDWS